MKKLILVLPLFWMFLYANRAGQIRFSAARPSLEQCQAAADAKAAQGYDVTACVDSEDMEDWH